MFTQLFYGVACVVGAYVFYKLRNELVFTLQEMKLIALFDSLTWFQKVLRYVGHVMTVIFAALVALYAIGALTFFGNVIGGLL
jgi:hypothetical protein